MKLRLAFALFTVLGLLVISGCGGDDGGAESTTDQGVATTPEQAGEQRSSADGGNRQSTEGGEGGPGAAAEPSLGAVVDNPTKSQLGIREGYDNSIQTFGEESEGGERDSAILAMRGLFDLIGRGDLEAACSTYFTSDYVQTLVGLADSAGVQPGDTPCATAAGVLAETTDQQALTAEARKALAATVLRVGVKGEEAILTLRTRQDVIAYFVMRREDGEWKATAFAIAPLRPVS